MSPLLGELKRRHVIRVAVAYLAAAWFVVQASDILVDAFELPRAVMRGVFVLLILALIPVLAVSWIYEITPDGLKRQSELPPGESGSQRTAGWLNRIVIGLLLAVVVLLLVDKFVLRHDSARSGAATATVAAGTTSNPDAGPRLPERPSIAVLPFESLSANPESGYFADGMTDDIITELSKLSGIFVIARNSSQTYKGKAVKVQQVASDLGVRYVLEGSVRRAGDTVRINAQLVDAIGGQHLWAERYDGALQDVFALQDKVIAQIVAALAISLTHDQQRSAERVETQIPEAYDALLQGWAYYRQGTEKDTAKALDRFEHAVELDPDYGRAHAAIAAASWRVVQSFWESTTVGGYQRGYDRMQQALAKAKTQPVALAYAISAEVLSKQGHYEQAFADLERAMSLAPNDADNYLSKARILNATGRAAEAEESVRWAMRLDPLYSPEYLRVLAVSQFHQQRYEAALATIERVLSLQSDVADDYTTLIAILGHLGRKQGVPEAIARFNEISLAAGYNELTVQMFGGTWWYGDIFNYDPAYRDQLIAGLRKSGVQEGAGADASVEKCRPLIHRAGAFYAVDGAITVDVAAAKALHDKRAKFVDVRAAKGFKEGHVPGAFNLDLGTEFSKETLARVAGRDDDLVLSCHGKTCPDSAFASAKAILWGYRHVYYFAAGFPAWKEAGLPVEASPAG